MPTAGGGSGAGAASGWAAWEPGLLLGDGDFASSPQLLHWCTRNQLGQPRWWDDLGSPKLSVESPKSNDRLKHEFQPKNVSLLGRGQACTYLIVAIA